MKPFQNSVLPPLDWALDTSFPAGPNTWSGQPTKVLPVTTKYTPGEHPAAEEKNYLENDRGARITEARNDLRRLQRLADMNGLRNPVYDTNVTDQYTGACVTSKGRVYVHKRGPKGFLLAPGGNLLSIDYPPTGNNRSTCAVANDAELVLFGDDDPAYGGAKIFDAETSTFSTVSSGGGATHQLLDAQASSAGGWVGLWVAGGAFQPYSVNASGPRTYRADSGRSLQFRSVDSAGTVGSNTASAALGTAMSANFTSGDIVRMFLVREGQALNTGLMVLVSGILGVKHFAFYSSDNGTNWTTVTLPAPYAGVDASASVEYCLLTGRFVLAISKGTETKTYYSNDAGVTWNLIATIAKNATHPGKGAFAPYDIRRMSSGLLVTVSFSVTPASGTTFWPVHASEDGGETWHLAGNVLRSGLPNAYMSLAGGDLPIGIFGADGNGGFLGNSGLFGFADR